MHAITLQYTPIWPGDAIGLPHARRQRDWSIWRWRYCWCWNCVSWWFARLSRLISVWVLSRKRRAMS